VCYIVHVVDLDDLIDAARAGDRQAREKLGRWLTDELLAFFAGHFKDHEIGDLVQQTLLELLQKLDEYEYRGPGLFQRWVHRFAGFKAKTKTRDVHRKRAREQKLRTELVAEPLTPDSMIYGLEFEEHLEECMVQLPPHEREALEHWRQGGADEELAAIAGVSANAIACRRHRGRKRLKALLGAALATPAPPPSPPRSPSSVSSSSSCN
jgi:RNA polymerase sigma factor (sigma-70 family)